VASLLSIIITSHKLYFLIIQKAVNAKIKLIFSLIIPVTVVWRAVDVSKSPVVGHVLGYEADLVDGMMVQAVLNVNSTVHKELTYNATMDQITIKTPNPTGQAFVILHSSTESVVSEGLIFESLRYTMG
jgi:hypothetical protein